MRLSLVFAVVLWASCQPPTTRMQLKVYDFDSLATELSTRRVNVIREVLLNHQPVDGKLTGPTSDPKEWEFLRDFNQINHPAFQGAIIKSGPEKDEHSNLSVTRSELLTEDFRFVFKRYFRQTSARVRRMEIEMVSTDFFHHSVREAVLDFDENQNGEELETFLFTYREKVLFGDTLHFQISGLVRDTTSVSGK